MRADAIRFYLGGMMFFKNKNKEDSKDNTLILPLLPLRDLVVFPHMIVPLFVGRKRSVAVLEEAEQKGNRILLVAQKNPREEDPAAEDIYDVGVIGEILQLLKLPDNTCKVLIEGGQRVDILRYTNVDDYFEAEVQLMEEEGPLSSEIKALTRNLTTSFEQYVKLNAKLPPETLMSTVNIEDPGQLADVVASHLVLSLTEKQNLLELTIVRERLEQLLDLLNNELEVLQIEKRLRSRVKDQMEKNQREYYLGEQMKAIQKELGAKDERAQEIEELTNKIKQAKMTKEAEEKSLKEIKRLQQMPPMSAETTVSLNYLDWLVSLPWSKKTREKLDMDEAENILREDHYGLEKVKERILEYLAVRRLVRKLKGPILCFVGPPGVGKTSLAKSIARATGRNFVRLSLGGVRDEAEIRGHRRTYVGALPGRIIQSMRKAKSKNPVFLLDEIDKMSTDFRGDPSAALLEVLDPEQNNEFNDHFLEVNFDLSEVLFVTTANALHNIPAPLRDRMEVIPISGYTEEEKIKIAEQFLISRQLRDNGLRPSNLAFNKQAIAFIIRRYTREAGVRNLNRELANICRKVARKVVKEGKNKTKVIVTGRNLHTFLGPLKFHQREMGEHNEVGVTTGLAWTEVGGDILSTEVSIVPGSGKLTTTGQLGNVMQESAQAAMSYVRSKACQLGLPKHFYRKIDIHIHVPEGAIPKDGPSAGITMATSLVSALTKRPARRDVAMTGEITLRGRVLPIGGLKEKVLAAHRAEISTIIIPKLNEKDLHEIPLKVKKVITFVAVEHMDEVLEAALMPESALASSAKEISYGDDCRQFPPPSPSVAH